MINASSEFVRKLKDGAEVQTYADITLSDGTVLHLTPDNFWIGGCTVDDKLTDGKFGTGFVIGKTLNLRISNHEEEFSQYDFYWSTIVLYVSMQLDDGTVEKIRKGTYFTTVPEAPGDIIELNAVDAMYRLDRDYASCITVYPATLQSIITGACLDCGIPIGFTEFDNMTFTVPEKPEKATYRQVVSWACQIAGYNARIDNRGYMQLVWYDTALLDKWQAVDGGDLHTYPHDEVISGGDFTGYGSVNVLDGGSFTDEMAEHIFQFKNLTVGTDDVIITGVEVAYEETSVISGESGYTIQLENNPFVAGQENEVAEYLGERLIGMYFRPFSGSALGNPLYEPYDVCRISDRRGNSYQTIINSVSYTVDSYTDIACEAEDPIRNGGEYLSEAARAIVEARRNAEKQITEYDRAVQNMNQLAMNAMGFHTTFEDQADGSRITYLHDKPELSKSKIIYKQTIDGFFLSQDGGKSYTAGFDSQGNAVLNILYVIGLVADWIRSGKFEVRKGDTITFSADADTGNVTIIADSFALSSGETINSIVDAAANKKCSVFTSQPKPPYNAGDLWFNGSDVLTCVTARKSGNYQKTDWEKKVDYIDQNAANTAASNAIKDMKQTEILNKLTNNGNDKAIYMLNGKLYISFSAMRGDELTLGGSNNVNGILRVLNSSGTEIGTWDKDGIHLKKGEINGPTITVGGNGNKEGIINVLNSSGFKSMEINSNGLKFFDGTNGSWGRARLYGSDEGFLIEVLADRQTNTNTAVFTVRLTKDGEFNVGAGKICLHGGIGEVQLPQKVYSYAIPQSTAACGATFDEEASSFNGSNYNFRLYRGTHSSRRYKDIGRDMCHEDIQGLYNIIPVWAKYKNGYLGENDERCGVEHPMFIAEDVEKYAPLAVDHNKEGKPENWNYRIMIPYMFQMIKSQKETIDSLTERIEHLESLVTKGSR